jgi:hypothetical protein
MSEPSKSARQTALPSETLGDGKVPPDARCEWCGRRATRSFPIMRKMKGGRKGATMPTGMFIYTCDDDADQGEIHTKDPKPALKK